MQQLGADLCKPPAQEGSGRPFEHVAPTETLQSLLPVIMARMHASLPSNSRFWSCRQSEAMQTVVLASRPWADKRPMLSSKNKMESCLCARFAHQ